ncbi:transposable element Tcb2 transposase [Trichonephila clavipes]|nr:transposable element Tcb2 transposase [Trichonephila clavipes]
MLPRLLVAAVAEWYRYRIVACLVTSSSPVPLKTRRVGQRCTLNLSRAVQLRCRPRHLTMVQNYVVPQHIQLLPWPTYSPDMSPIEHVLDLVGWRLARDPRPAASKDELLLRIQAISNSLLQADIQDLFDSMPVV